MCKGGCVHVSNYTCNCNVSSRCTMELCCACLVNCELCTTLCYAGEGEKRKTVALAVCMIGELVLYYFIGSTSEAPGGCTVMTTCSDQCKQATMMNFT